LAQDQIPERQDHHVSMTTKIRDGAGQTAHQAARPVFRTVQARPPAPAACRSRATSATPCPRCCPSFGS
jgi:hypothetical protein